MRRHDEQAIPSRRPEGTGDEPGPLPRVRPATVADVRDVHELQMASMRGLGPGFYTRAEIEAAVTYICVPDRDLIEDGTYLVAEMDGRIVGCGGWSRRRKAYAGPSEIEVGGADLLDCRTDPTNIRAMFTAPDQARRGVGRAILGAAERAARAAGFRRARLGAMLSAEVFYRRAGSVELERESPLLPDGTAFPVIVMAKALVS